VGPIALRAPRRAWLTGFAWGSGHAAGVGALGAGAWLAKDALPLEAFSHVSERLVGVVLVAIGLWALRSTLPLDVHVHEHSHDGTRHRHVHAHRAGTDHAHPTAHTHTHAAAGVGALHGFAGTAHLVGVLPAVALDASGAAAAYLLGYAAGSILAMTGFAAGLGALARSASRSGVALVRPLMVTAAIAAVAVGVYWLAGA
jgi:hypothetical protein